MSRTAACTVVAVTVVFAFAVEPVGFVEPLRLQGSGRLLDMSLADVDGDGDLDLLTANRLEPHYVGWFENNGSGLFAAEAFLPGAFDSPASLVLAGDVDRDGDVDVVTGGIAGNRVRLLRNDGTGTFAAETIESLHAEGAGGVLADLDGDGDLDFAHHALGSVVTVFAGDGAGRFTGATTLLESVGAGPAIAAGDLDGRPGLEIVHISNQAREAHVYAAESGLQYARTQVLPLPGAPSDVVTADLDGDGDADAAAALLVGTDGATGARIQLLVNDGTGALAAGELLDVGAYATGLTVADVNADGTPDLVAANALGEAVIVLGEGGGSYLPAQRHASGLSGTAYQVVAAELDGDPRAEVVLGTWQNSTSSPTVIALFRHSDLPGPRDLVAEPSVVKTSGTVDVRLLGADLQNLAVVDAGEDLPVAQSSWVSSGEVGVRLEVPPGLGSRSALVSLTHPDGKRAYAGLDFESVDVAVTRGSIVDRRRPRSDRADLRGTVTYNSLADREAFTFANDDLTVRWGDPAAPEAFTIPANDVRWNVRGGRRHAWRSGRGARPGIRVLLDTSTGDFRLRVRRADFSAPIGEEVRLEFEATSFGRMVNRGAATSAWRRDRRGRLRR